MVYKGSVLLSIFLLSICSTINGQTFLKAEGKIIVNENGEEVILKGMGLGGWMLQEGYMLQTAGFANAQYKIKEKITELIGTEDTDLFYNQWLSNHVRKIDIDSLKSWGFNSVRLPMHYNLFTLPIEEEPVPGQHTWLEKGFILTDSLISWCRQNRMYVILDLHAAPGGQGKDEGISDYNPDKPSLWESQANRDKTVALWKRLAERYSDEPVVAGYDMINETNWELFGNVPLRELYGDITQAIREVDKRHILFVEGNWFANDFTGLTPPWDDNIVYSPHKYWSINDQASIQWVLDIRDNFNVPLYFGESGENSNTWFRDAIKLLEEHNIGWAWWPMKKIESIAGPLSIVKSPGYQSLLDYWDGRGPEPTAAKARTALTDLGEKLKLENCIFQKDVIDAMFRQVHSDEAIPFRTHEIPGIVYATDFDMGILGSAYRDIGTANYQVSTGNFTAWNNGWTYRNDGVDIEKSSDHTNSNGYNVGWLSKDEWMQYEVDIDQGGLYDIIVRVAANDGGGKFHFASGEADLTGTIDVPATGGWQEWMSVIVPNVILDTSDSKLRFHVDEIEFNMGSFEFIKSGESTELSTQFVSAVTLNEESIQVNINKPLSSSAIPNPHEFSITINGSGLMIENVMIDPDNPRILIFEVNHVFKSSEEIKIAYNGTNIQAKDGTALEQFDNKIVRNKIAIVHLIPGKIEAEDYFFQSGIQLENSTDEGGGQNIGFLDRGDYIDFYIDVAEDGIYNVDYRTAAQSEIGEIELQLVDDESTTSLHKVSFPSTGGWQTWATTSKEVSLPEGKHQLRIVITQPLFNINWLNFSLLTSTEETRFISKIVLSPNPGTGLFSLKGALEKSDNLELSVYNSIGQRLIYEELDNIKSFDGKIDLRGYPDGLFYIAVRSKSRAIYTDIIIKTN